MQNDHNFGAKEVAVLLRRQLQFQRPHFQLEISALYPFDTFEVEIGLSHAADCEFLPLPFSHHPLPFSHAIFDNLLTICRFGILLLDFPLCYCFMAMALGVANAFPSNTSKISLASPTNSQITPPS